MVCVFFVVFVSCFFFFFLMIRRPPRSTLFPYTTSSDLGMTERERRLLLRQRSDVTSWRSVLLGKSSQQAAQPAPSGSQSLSDSSAPTRRSAARSVTSVGKD